MSTNDHTTRLKRPTTDPHTYKTTWNVNTQCKHNLKRPINSPIYQQYSYKEFNRHHLISLLQIRETVIARHASIASRRRQGSPNVLSNRWPPQAHSRHIMCRPTNQVRRHHILHSIRRKRPPTKRDPHDLRRCSIEGSD